jgi:carbamoyltransferase
MTYFNYCHNLTMTNGKFDELFGGPARKPESQISQREMDVACSIQEVTEEAMLRMARHVHKETGEKNLCLAGGVALNCVGNGRILREGPFEQIWVQPAAGDAGGALGACLSIWHQYLGNERCTEQVKGAHADGMRGSYLGPAYSDDEIGAFLDSTGAAYRRLEADELAEYVAGELAQERVVGWFQGRMEFGPRALGARSILGDPRSPAMQAQMNLKIKFRESFRQFAPSILRERVSDYFEIACDSPYMLLVAPVQKQHRVPATASEESLFGIERLNIARSTIPAVTHVDYSARVQTVSREDNPLYYDLIAEFEKHTGCPIVVNTSFNVRGEPIVCSPEHAFTCFMRTEMDMLVMGSYVLHKCEQDAELLNGDLAWQREYALD